MSPVVVAPPTAPAGGGGFGVPDAPVLTNGLVRVRYDANLGYPGLRFDAWNGSAFVEQGKLCVRRIGSSPAFDDTWVSASLREWTPERAVAEVALRASVDANSLETVFVTLQRGWRGARVECYPAPNSAGQVDGGLLWTPTVGDANDSVFKNDTQASIGGPSTAAVIATAGSGSALFGATATIGASAFSGSENWLALLRCVTDYKTVSPFQTSIVVVQAALGAKADSTSYGTVAYGTTANDLLLSGSGGLGYVSARIGFVGTVSDQVNEAETIRNTGSGTTSQVADASASGGQTVKDTQTSDANHTLSKASNLLQAKYRLLVRARVDSGTTGAVKGAIGSVTTSQVGLTSSTYTWLDLGDVLATAANATVTFDAWVNMATPVGGVYLDRYEAVLVEDRTRSGAQYGGVRDTAQAALTDSRALGAVTAR